MKKDYYDVEDLMKKMQVSRGKAYNIIRALNNKQISEGVPKGALIFGRVSRKYANEILKLN